MITLETGVPGAGKTLYCIDKLLRPLQGAVLKREVDGVMVETPRKIYSNINGLLLDHEKIDREGLLTWHEWAQPGSVIVFDEVQKVPGWDLQPNGSKVHESVKALETHRHAGVDFIILTQHPMLIHQNVVRLVGRHLHVRRMGNMPFAVVYEWDSASRTLLYKNSITKAPWKYDKSVYELYKSAEAHTKSPRKIPRLIWVAAVALVGMLVLSPSTWSRIGDRINPPPVVKSSQAPKTPASGALASARPASAPYGPPGGMAGPPRPAPVAAAPVRVTGCAAIRDMCRCFLSDGELADKPLEYCHDRTQPVVKHVANEVSVAAALESGGSVSVDSRADKDLYTWLARRAGRTPY